MCKGSSQISAGLAIGLRDDDSEALYEIKKTLKCGKIRVNNHDALKWECRDVNKCRFILVPLFYKYPLRAKKQRDYRIWRELVMAISGGHHLNGNRNYVLSLCQQLKDIKKYVPPSPINS